MYNRVQAYGLRINQLERDTSENHGRLDAFDGRLRSLETVVTRIDTNVSELLRVQTRDSPVRRLIGERGE